MSVVLVTGAARPNSIAAGVVPRLVADGWTVVTSDLNGGDHPCDLSTPDGPHALVEEVTHAHGAISGLVLSHAHDVESGVLDTTAESFDTHVAFTSDHTTGNLPYGASEEVRDGLLPHHPLGRLGTPRDIAALTSFLLSAEGRWVSGQLLHADGGFSARY